MIATKIPFILILALTYLTLSCTNTEAEDSYIKFKYSGSDNDSIPQAVFFPHSISKETIGFGSGFHTTREEYENIKKLIQRNEKLIRLKVLNDSAIGGKYNFYIIEMPTNVVYYSNEKQVVDTIFSEIQSQVTDSAKKQVIKKGLENIFRHF